MSKLRHSNLLPKLTRRPNWAAFKQYNRPCESCTTAKQPCRIRALRYLPRWGWVQEDCLPCAESGVKCSRSVLVTQLAVQMPAVDVVRVEKIGLSKGEVLGLVRTAARGGSVDLAGFGGDALSAVRVTRAHAEEVSGPCRMELSVGRKEGDGDQDAAGRQIYRHELPVKLRFPPRLSESRTAASLIASR